MNDTLWGILGILAGILVVTIPVWLELADQWLMSKRAAAPPGSGTLAAVFYRGPSHELTFDEYRRMIYRAPRR